MSESLKNRVGRVVAGGVHALLDRLEDAAPEAAMEQAIREADGVIDDVRHELGVLAANRHLAQQQHAKLNAQHEALVAQVELALGEAREDLARAAVARQLDIEAQLPVLESSLAEFVRQEGELQGYVAALLAKKREMQDALADFRRSRAVASNPSGLGIGSPSSAGARLEKASDAFDRVYERQTGIAPGARNSNLEQAAKLRELDEMARDSRIAQRLAEIKARKG